MDKPQFKQKLKSFIEENDIKTVSNFDESAYNIIVCTAVEDFEPESNEMWDLPQNKSYPRDLTCAGCKRQIVMSDAMFDMHQKAKKKPKVMCGKCVLKKINK